MSRYSVLSVPPPLPLDPRGRRRGGYDNYGKTNKNKKRKERVKLRRTRREVSGKKRQRRRRRSSTLILQLVYFAGRRKNVHIYILRYYIRSIGLIETLARRIHLACIESRLRVSLSRVPRLFTHF